MRSDPSAEGSRAPYGAPMPLPGDVIAGKYRVEAVVGRGGMSVVYRATHLSLDQQVAIKVLSAAALLMPEYVVRLQREARAVSRIRSEHVVRVFDIGELPAPSDAGAEPRMGVPYLVMEHLTGQDLAAVLRRGPVSVDLAVTCIMQACEALAEAHALGIIHRDLKPANLFLTESVDGSPCVKLLDFGISRTIRRAGLSPLTDPGTVLGTPSYMAPEQMEASDKVDARSDIWALGAILYELLVGKPPYQGESLPQIFMKIMRSRTPKPSASRAGVPRELDAIVTRCLSVDPEDRYPSVAELARALSVLGTEHAKDSAARIARVLDRHRADVENGSGALPPPVVRVVRSQRTTVTRPLSIALAMVTLFGVGGAFAGLATRTVREARVEASDTVSGLSMADEAYAATAEPVTREESPADAGADADAGARR